MLDIETLPVAITFFLLGLMFGKPIMETLTPQVLRDKISADRMTNLLPVLRKQLEKELRLNLNDPSHRHICVVSESTGLLGVTVCSKEEDGTHRTDVYVKFSAGGWKKI